LRDAFPRLAQGARRATEASRGNAWSLAPSWAKYGCFDAEYISDALKSQEEDEEKGTFKIG
jgi:hypothetical protein